MKRIYESSTYIWTDFHKIWWIFLWSYVPKSILFYEESKVFLWGSSKVTMYVPISFPSPWYKQINKDIIPWPQFDVRYEHSLFYWNSFMWFFSELVKNLSSRSSIISVETNIPFFDAYFAVIKNICGLMEMFVFLLNKIY